MFGCNDRAVTPPIFVVDPGEEDMSVDMPPTFSDVECRSKSDGQGCILARGTGTCVRGECRVLACEFGWADCNQTRLDGCETPVSTEDNCGYCGTECSELETCQSGSMGWTCSAGRLCPPNRFDLDFEEENGCEWRADWLPAESTLIPFLELTQIIQQDGAWSYSGLLDSELVLVYKGTEVDVAGMSQSPGGLVDLGDRMGVVFNEQVLLVGPGAEAVEVVLPACEEAGVFVTVLDAAEPAFISRNRVEFGQQVYDRDWYLNEFQADFNEAEMSQCDACALDGCLSACARPASCGTCTAISGLCPDFEVLAAELIEDRLVLLTRRGIVVLGGGDPTRLESEFVPGVVSGAEFSQMRTLGTRGALLSGSGRLRFLRLEAAPTQTSADLGLSSESGLKLLSLSEVGAILERDGVAVMVQPAEASGRVVEFNSAGSAGGAAQKFVGVHEEDGNIDLIFSGSGLFQRLRLSQVR